MDIERKTKNPNPGRSEISFFLSVCGGGGGGGVSPLYIIKEF